MIVPNANVLVFKAYFAEVQSFANALCNTSCTTVQRRQLAASDDEQLKEM